MSEEDMISQIKDLISDRKSFITKDEESSEIFKKDVKALEEILDKYDNQQKIILKSIRIIDKFKEMYIICFDKPLWEFVKRLEKCLKKAINNRFFCMLFLWWYFYHLKLN